MQRLVPSIFPSLWWSSSTTGSTSCRRASPPRRPSPNRGSRATVAHPARRPPCTPCANPQTRRTTTYTSPTTTGTPAVTSHVSIELPVFKLPVFKLPVLLSHVSTKLPVFKLPVLLSHVSTKLPVSNFLFYWVTWNGMQSGNQTRWSCSCNSDQIEHKTLLRWLICLAKTGPCAVFSPSDPFQIYRSSGLLPPLYDSTSVLGVNVVNCPGF